MPYKRYAYKKNMYWVYDHEMFTRCQALLGDAKSAKEFEISHLVCKLWFCKVQKRSNSSFLEMYLLGVVT